MADPAVKLHLEPIYGFYHGQDPRTFEPDVDCCSKKEIAAHKEACEAAERGEWKRDDSGCSCPRPGVLVSKSSFGIGVYHVVMTWDGDFIRGATYEDMQREGCEWEEELAAEVH